MGDEADGAIDLTNCALDKGGQKRLSPRECLILRGSLAGKTYGAMAAESGRSEEYLRKDLGAKLWKRLSIALWLKVTKDTITDALKIYRDQQNRVVSPDIDPDVDPDIQPVDDRSLNPDFLGREEDLKALDGLIRQGRRAIVIQAGGGVGKTTLARQYLATRSFEKVIELPMAKETQNVTPVESIVEEWLTQEFGQNSVSDFGIALTRLKKQMQLQRVAILIDNLEPALDPQGRFVVEHRNYVELLRVLTDPATNCVLLLTSRDRLCESAISVYSYRLSGLDLVAWRTCFEQRQIAIDEPALAAMHHAYGGNAKAMDILGGAIIEDSGGNLANYWQANQEDLLLHPELEDLVSGQFDRLARLDLDAYRLLCRMGCYRYQEVPTVPIEGLFCLMWDIPSDRHRQVVEALKRRSLIDWNCENAQLHPVIRKEALLRLTQLNEIEKSNQAAGHFWIAVQEKISQKKK